MSELFVSRMSATDNTFFIVNGFDPAWTEVLSQWDESKKIIFTKKMCRRYFGFHTDGLLFLRPHASYDFAWEFYNSDGSSAEMCGNAARCAVLYFHQRINDRKSVEFLTGAGPVGGEVLPSGEVRVQMPPIRSSRQLIAQNVSGVFTQTGVPHFVIEREPDSELARQLRKADDFGPAGANITFIHDLEGSSLSAVTFERGVEGFTQACGTGAVAAAVAFGLKAQSSSLVTVRMPGGELKIENVQVNQRPYLTGPAQFEFDLSHWSHDEKL